MYDYLFYNFYGRERSQNYVLDKNKSIHSYKGYMFNRLYKMFKWNGLPDTIPDYMLEFFLMVNGSCVIAKHNSRLYAFIGSFGGEPDPYYRPTQYVVANPALKFNKTFDLFLDDSQLADDCVFFTNDILWMGLNPLMSRYATLMAENVITMRTADVLLRAIAMLSAPDDKTKAAGELYLKNLEDGKLGVIGENRFFEGIKMQSPPSNNGSYLTQFIELQQYYKGSFFNEIGLSSSFNMKRESINEAEAGLNKDTLFPLIDTMLECRQKAASRLNEVFGCEVSVEFDSEWKQNLKEEALQIEGMENEISGDESDSSSQDDGEEQGHGEPSDRDGNDRGNFETDNGCEEGDNDQDICTDMQEAGVEDEEDKEEPEGNEDETVTQEVNVNVNVNIDSQLDGEEEENEVEEEQD